MSPGGNSSVCGTLWSMYYTHLILKFRFVVEHCQLCTKSTLVSEYITSEDYRFANLFWIYNTMGYNKVVYICNMCIMPSVEFSLASIKSALKETVFCLVISINSWGMYFGNTFSKCFKAATFFTNILAISIFKSLWYLRISSSDSNQFEASRWRISATLPVKLVWGCNSFLC